MTVGNMPPAEVAVTADQVAALVAAQHSELAESPVVLLDHGWDNFLFRLGDRWLARLPRRQMAVELIRNELRWLPILGPRLPIPTPIPVFAGAPGEGYPWPWSIVEWIPGVPARSASHLDLERSARDLGEFLRALHREAPARAPSNPYRGVPLADRDEAMRERVALLGDLIDGQAALELWDAALANPPHPGPPVWLHGDLHPLNVIIEEGALSGIVDFGDLTAGDPATDVSCAWTVLAGHHLDEFRNAYGEIDEYTWRRARGWALLLGVAYVANSADNPLMRSIGEATISAALSS